jgi:threonine dehydrogenase-like Zn-dependent dehydrogenase
MVKAARYYGPRDIRVEEIDEPAIDSGEVGIRVAAAGICGSDMHWFTEHISGSSLEVGTVLGHELSGTVIEVGEGVSKFKLNDRVVIEPLIGCQECRFCRTGKYHLCPDLAHIGGKYSGGFAEFSKAPHEKVRKLPPSVSLEEASIVDCLAVGVHAINRVPPKTGDTVAILGAGTIGLSVMQVARACGARTIVIDLLQSSLELARKAGASEIIDASTVDVEEAIKAHTSGAGADIVYEAVGGRASTIEQAIRIVSRGGRIGVIGSFTGVTSFNFFDLLVKEVDLVPIWSYSTCGFRSEFDVALDLLSRGLVCANVLITHRVSLDNINQGFELMERKCESGAGKVLVIP